MTVKDYKEKQKYIDKAKQVEKQYNLPENMLVGLLKTESNLNPKAVNPSSKAKGIAQFMDLTAKEFGIDPFEPFQSIEAAGKYLSNNYKKLGNWDDTLRSYNMGLGGVRKWKAGKIGLSKETQEYVGKVYTNANIEYTPDKFKEQVKEDFTVLSTTNNLPTFARTVPQSSTIEEEEIKKDVEELRQQTNEYNFIQELANLRAQQQQQFQQTPIQEESEYEQQIIPQQNILDTYNKVSNFIDTPTSQTMQQGGTIIGNLNPTQQADIENQREWLNNWNKNRVVKGQKVNSDVDIPFSKNIYIDDLNYNSNNGKVTYGEFDSVSNRLIFDENYTNKPGIPSHEFSHRFQKDYSKTSPENYNRFVAQPINKYLKKSGNFTPYQLDPDETHSELNRLRYNQGFLPDQIIKPEDLDKIDLNQYNFNQFNKEEFLDILNSTADNNNSSNNYLAQQGGEIIQDYIEIKDSKIQGKGVFAKQDILEGQNIGLAHTNNQPSTDLGRMHNHSEKPNSYSIKFGNNRYIFPLRKIKKGEEITVDYRKQPELEQPENFKK